MQLVRRGAAPTPSGLPQIPSTRNFSVASQNAEFQSPPSALPDSARQSETTRRRSGRHAHRTRQGRRLGREGKTDARCLPPLYSSLFYVPTFMALIDGSHSRPFTRSLRTNPMRTTLPPPAFTRKALVHRENSAQTRPLQTWKLKMINVCQKHWLWHILLRNLGFVSLTGLGRLPTRRLPFHVRKPFAVFVNRQSA